MTYFRPEFSFVTGQYPVLHPLAHVTRIFYGTVRVFKNVAIFLKFPFMKSQKYSKNLLQNIANPSFWHHSRLSNNLCVKLRAILGAMGSTSNLKVTHFSKTCSRNNMNVWIWTENLQRTKRNEHMIMRFTRVSIFPFWGEIH